MFSRRNLLILLVLVLALAAGGYYLWQQQVAAEQAAAAAIRQETVQRGTLLALVSATGPLVPESQVNLVFGTSTPLRVQQVKVTLGQTVKKGAVLAQLDTADLEFAVTQAEQSLAAAKLTLTQLQTPPRAVDVAAAEANLRVAKSQVFAASVVSTYTEKIAYSNLLAAQNALWQVEQAMSRLTEPSQYAQKQTLSKQQEQLAQNAQIANLRYQQAKTPPSGAKAVSALAAVEQAQVTLDKLLNGASTEDLQIAELQVHQAEVALTIAQNNLKDAQLIAPFDGVVAAVNIREGELAVGGLPAVVLVDTSRFYVDVNVDEVDIGRIVPGQLVSITLDALPEQVFTGRVEKIATQSTNNAGIVSYPVRVVLESKEPLLRGGLTSTANIVVREAKDIVLVPNWAVKRTQGEILASVLRNGQIQEIPIKLGQRNEDYSEVLSGLSEGDIVAVSTARQEFSFFGDN